MYGKVKLSKRQIKEDKFTTAMLRAKSQFMDNWQFYAIGALVVVLVCVAVVYFVQSQQTAKTEAAAMYARGAMEARQGNTQVAILSLTEIVDEHGGTAAAKQATFLLGKVSFESRNYPEAIRYFQLYLDKYTDDQLNRAAAQAGLAACHENQGEYLPAASGYESAISEWVDGPMVALYHQSALRNFLQAGDVEAARAHLTALESDFAGSEVLAAARLLFAEKGQS